MSIDYYPIVIYGADISNCTLSEDGKRILHGNFHYDVDEIEYPDCEFMEDIEEYCPGVDWIHSGEEGRLFVGKMPRYPWDRDFEKYSKMTREDIKRFVCKALQPYFCEDLNEVLDFSEEEQIGWC